MRGMQLRVQKRSLSTIKKQLNVAGGGNRTHQTGNSENDRFFKSLPKVPMTKYLEQRELSNDILYSGYRPILYPMKNNPLFRNKSHLIVDDNGTSDSVEIETEEWDPLGIHNEQMFGRDDCGGIKTCGINGTWKYNPQVSIDLLPFNIWNSSCLGMEIYKEWSKVPSKVIKDLKPYDRYRK